MEKDEAYNEIKDKTKKWSFDNWWKFINIFGRDVVKYVQEYGKMDEYDLKWLGRAICDYMCCETCKYFSEHPFIREMEYEDYCELTNEITYPNNI